jgi:hypothetical protein
LLSNYKNSPKFAFGKQEKLTYQVQTFPPVGTYNESLSLVKRSPLQAKFGTAKKGDEYWRKKQNCLSPGPIYHYQLPDDLTHKAKQEKVPKIEKDILELNQRRTRTDFTKIYPHSYNLQSSFTPNKGNIIGPPSKYLDDLFHSNRMEPNFEDKNTPSPTKYSVVDSSKLSTCKSSQQYSIPKDPKLLSRIKGNPNLSPASYKFDNLTASSNFIKSEGYSFGKSIKKVDVREVLL